jgi:cytochrome c-type biogenesis protein
MAGLSSAALAGLAFSAGTATFFAPCAFPLLPGYVSYFIGTTTSTAAGRSGLVDRIHHPISRAVLLSVVARFGMTAVYAALTWLTAVVGAAALSEIAVLELVVGAVFVLGGGLMAAGWKPDRLPVRLPERRRSVAGFLSFGVLYAAAAAGCTAPLFVAVVTCGITAGPAAALLAGGAYALGMTVMLFGVSVAAAIGGSSAASVLGDHTGAIYRIAGGLLACSGLAEIYYYYFRGFPEVIAV